MTSSSSSPASTRRISSWTLPALSSPTNHIRTRVRASIAASRSRGGEASLVAQLGRELDRAGKGLLGGIDVDVEIGHAEPFTERRLRERLPELEGRAELRGRVAIRCGALAHAPGQLRRRLLVVAGSKRGGPPELDVDLERPVLRGLCEGAELGKALEPVRRAPEDREGVVATREERASIRHRG